MDGGAWWATVHGVTKSQTRLNAAHKEGKEGEKEKSRKNAFVCISLCVYFLSISTHIETPKRNTLAVVIQAFPGGPVVKTLADLNLQVHKAIWNLPFQR